MPRYGFNFQWMFHHHPGSQPAAPDLPALDFLAEHGFDFVRVPLSYRFWTSGFDYFDPDQAVWEHVDAYLEACWSRGLHLCLNLHRAPGYCINGADSERHNLWQHAIAQDAFVFLWEQLAWRYRSVPAAVLSFDLLNEPPHEGWGGFTRSIYAALMRRTSAAIRAIDPERELVINGIGDGNLAVPELAGLGATHSTRGYQPMPVSHWQASWWRPDAQPGDHDSAVAPVYPGVRWQGRVWDLAVLRACYQPWRAVQARGVAIHVGEFGCFRHTPNEVALRWLEDLLSLYHEFGWGYSLWEFAGPFGIVAHGRPGARYRRISGFEVDPSLFDLLLSHRV